MQFRLNSSRYPIQFHAQLLFTFGLVRYDLFQGSHNRNIKLRYYLNGPCHAMRKYPHKLATAKVTLKLFLIPLQNLASAINNILMDHGN